MKNRFIKTDLKQNYVIRFKFYQWHLHHSTVATYSSSIFFKILANNSHNSPFYVSSRNLAPVQNYNNFSNNLHRLSRWIRGQRVFWYLLERTLSFWGREILSFRSGTITRWWYTAEFGEIVRETFRELHGDKGFNLSRGSNRVIEI